jgi:hypothetical protein
MGSPPSAHRPQLVRRLAPVPALGGSGPCWKATDGEVWLIDRLTIVLPSR